MYHWQNYLDGFNAQGLGRGQVWPDIVEEDNILGGNLWVVVIVKSCVNKLAGSLLATQEWTTNEKPGQQVDPTLDNDYDS